MSKLPVVSGAEVVKALERFGFRVVRRRGNHVRLKKVTEEKAIKITVPDHKTLKKKTLSRIIKAAGLNIAQFRELL